MSVEPGTFKIWYQALLTVHDEGSTQCHKCMDRWRQFIHKKKLQESPLCRWESNSQPECKNTRTLHLEVVLQVLSKLTKITLSLTLKNHQVLTRNCKLYLKTYHEYPNVKLLTSIARKEAFLCSCFCFRAQRHLAAHFWNYIT